MRDEVKERIEGLVSSIDVQDVASGVNGIVVDLVQDGFGKEEVEEYLIEYVKKIVANADVEEEETELTSDEEIIERVLNGENPEDVLSDYGIDVSEIPED